MLKSAFLVALSLLTALRTYGSDLDLCVKDNYLAIKKSVVNTVERNATPEVNRFLIHLYEENGISLNASQISVSKVTVNLMSLRYDFSVVSPSHNNYFYAEVGKATGFSTVKATNNAIYDAFGNLVSPATEVVCTGMMQVRRAISIRNASTDYLLGEVHLPEGLQCDAGTDTCEISGSVTIPL